MYSKMEYKELFFLIEYVNDVVGKCKRNGNVIKYNTSGKYL